MQINTSNHQMYLDKLVLFREPKIVNNMHRRSFAIGSDVETVRNLEEISKLGYKFDDMLLVNKCSNLINLTPTTTGGIIVPNGWNEDRLSFIMSVVIKESSTKTNFYFISGYTDYYDPILGKEITHISQIDSRMNFIINNITLVSELISALNNEPVYNFLDEIAIVKNNGITEYDNMLNDDYLVRPVDIFTGMWNHGISNNLTTEGVEISKNSINPVSYIGNILDTIANGMKLSGSEDQDDERAIGQRLYAMARDAEQKETPIVKCPFLAALYDETREPRPSVFNMANLINIFGLANVDAVTKFLMFSEDTIDKNKSNMYQQHNVDNILTTNALEDTINPSIENMIALEFYYMLSTVLFKKKITSATVTCSNHPSFFMEEVAMVNNAYSHFHTIFTSIPSIDYLDRYLKTIILPKITKNRNILVNVVADIDILGKTTIAVTVENGKPTVFRYNSSMDNNFTPLVANKQGKDLLVDDLFTIIDTIF